MYVCIYPTAEDVTITIPTECATDTHTCEDNGEVLTRDPTNNCEFPECKPKTPSTNSGRTIQTYYYISLIIVMVILSFN